MDTFPVRLYTNQTAGASPNRHYGHHGRDPQPGGSGFTAARLLDRNGEWGSTPEPPEPPEPPKFPLSRFKLANNVSRSISPLLF